MPEENNNALQLNFQLYVKWAKENWKERILIPSIAVVASFIVTGNTVFLWNVLVAPMLKLLLTIIGTAIGVGLGLGLAMHVYEHLQEMVYRHEHGVDAVNKTNGDSGRNSSNFSSPSKKSNFPSVASSSVWTGEESAYSSLMNTAGYDVSDQFLRGQVVRGSTNFFDLYYPFTDEPDINKWKSVVLMRKLWPTLPDIISIELGKFMEYTMRDFVSSWYRYMDAGIVYEDEREKRKRLKESKDEDENNEKTTKDENETSENVSKVMIFSTARHRPAPMMAAVYESLGIVFGNLSTRVEGVNLFSLVLIKWTKVLSHSFRVYRKIRKEILEKNSSTKKNVLQKYKLLVTSKHESSTESTTNEETGIAATAGRISEMSIAREFMKKGKLHRAITFGMDVPSLLFGDARGEECGVPDNLHIKGVKDDKILLTDDEILEKRLFDGKLLNECETDYNRVLGQRLLRALLPRAEFTSPVIRMAMTELLAGSILTPMMGMFCPEMINDLIIMGCDDTSKDKQSKKGNEHQEKQKLETSEKIEFSMQEKRQRSHESLNSLSKGAEGITVDVDGDTNALKSVGEGNSAEMKMKETDFFNKVQENTVVDDDNIDEVFDEGSAMQVSSNNSEEENESFEIENGEEGHNDKSISRSAADTVNDPDSSDNNKLHGTSTKETILEELNESKPLPSADFVFPMLTMSIIDLQRLIDFQEWRDAQEQQINVDVKWEDPEMQEAITQLVLVIEAALLHGRKNIVLKDEQNSGKGPSEIDESENGGGITIHASSLANTLMEITNDPDEFEDKILQEEEDYLGDQQENDQESIEYWGASSSDLSTLRSLIAAWLHTGQAHRVMSVFIGAQNTILKPFFYQHAFLRNRESADGFVRQLRQLNGVHLYVDTSVLLSTSSMDVNEDGKVATPKPNAKPRLQESSPLSPGTVKNSNLIEKVESSKLKLGVKFGLRGLSTEANPDTDLSLSIVQASGQALTLPQAYVSSSGLPRFIDFRRNENFASSLRAERERRTKSWVTSTQNSKGLQGVSSRKVSSSETIASHRDLHHISRIFYAGTNLIALRTGARRKNTEGTDKTDGSDVISVSLFTVEMACQRRRLEVPDDDSSFLLRAQSRPLNAVGVHRDQRNHDMSFKSFAATYEEPAFRKGQTRYTGGRYIRKCLLRYHPNDRTAKIVISTDRRFLDNRKEKETLSDKQPSAFLQSDFLRERHLCQKWTPKGATQRTGSILASSVMEVTDFSAVPRSGKALDFIYRISLFERPMVELGGKRFTVHDSAIMGPHRADASSLEMSDAALSMVLLTMGDEWEEQIQEDENGGSQRKFVKGSSVEVGSDGYPIVWMKYTRKQGDNNVTEVKSYRASFVRAALMVTSARQDAQLQCLIRCVKAGSARSATKQRTEAYLKPTASLLEYANSSEREKQSILLRDLKLGMNHIDKGQLTRNGLLSPRFPTQLRGLIAKCEGAAQVKDNTALAVPGIGAPSITMYKIRCCALVRLVDIDLRGEDLTPFMSPDGSISKFFREEWVIYRPMKDIQLFHKHLKTQVATTEQSASAGARLVGAATAAFTVSGQLGSNRRRKAMIPSLGQVQKGGGLGMSKKSIQKRCGIVNEYFQYLLADDHPLNRCSELLMFLGAFYPFPPDVVAGGDAVTNKSDPLGRLEMKREVYNASNKASDKSISSTVDSENNKASKSHIKQEDNSSTSAQNTGELVESTMIPSKDENTVHKKKSNAKKTDMIPSIKAKIDEVPLVKVRSTLFELLRYQFDFDNANFFRNRMFAAMKTMSFAVTSSAEFRKMLYKTHLEYLSANALADWIKFLTDTLYPDGVFLKFSSPTPEEELVRKANKSKQDLLKAFPDQIRSVLGPEMTSDGLHMIHEMLQNRLILKSMSYMLIDLVWLEIFPELHDILTGPAALESDY